MERQVKESTSAASDKEEPFPARLEGEGIEHGTFRSGSSPQEQLLRNTLRAWHWAGYKRMFDIAATVCPTDRSWEVVHKQIMDIGAEQERSLATILARLYPRGRPSAPEQVTLDKLRQLMADLDAPEKEKDK